MPCSRPVCNLQHSGTMLIFTILLFNEKAEKWELPNLLTCELWVRREVVPEVSSFLTPGNDFMDTGIYSQKHCMSDVPD